MINKTEFKISKLLTQWLVMPNLYVENKEHMQTNNMNKKLQAQLNCNIEQRKRLLEKRAFAHAQTMFPIDDLTLEPPDYGLGVIPKLTAVNNTNEEAQRIIESCNVDIVKLSVIQRLMNNENTQTVLELLNNNQYHTLTIEKIKEIFGAKEITLEEILYS